MQVCSDRRTRRRRLLVVSMYPIDGQLRGPAVRVTNMIGELKRSVDVDVIAGYRGARRGQLVRYAFAGRLRRLDGIYVESSTFLPSEMDVAFLALARALGIPILTFIRDAYQLFPEYYSKSSVKRWVSAAAFRPAMRALAAVSTSLAFPSAGLARAIFGSDAHAVIIPPGSPPSARVTRNSAARRLLYVGNGTLDAQGAPRLIAAVGAARARGVEVELTVVSPPGEEPSEPWPAWLRVVHAEADAIRDLLPDIMGTVIPRPRNAYNDLALPIKLFDYLAFGRPLLVTDCTEQAAIVVAADAGLVVHDGEMEMSDGVERMMAATEDQLDRWSGHALDAAARHSWQARARAVLETLRLIP